MDREKCCCFTGHRPEKLPWGRNGQSPAFHRAMAAVEAAIIAQIEDGCTWFYTGMARGMDLWAAQIVLKYRDLGAGEQLGVRLCAVLPCADQAARWNREDQALHTRVLAQADEKVVLAPRYAPGCMQARNRYLVEHAGHVIALYDGRSPGGTRQTLELARRAGLAATVIDPAAPALYPSLLGGE
ncbi:Uncharacterized protein conserved in bacteria [uncultured Clostridium sp.]|nr:Uncharacterized protein conserved in bacteria [uncultured Clostridium sp.]